MRNYEAFFLRVEKESSIPTVRDTYFQWRKDERGM